MNYVDKCICGSMKYQKLMKHNVFVKNGEIVQCNECGFIWFKSSWMISN
jgi:hypothetical protein